MWVRPARLAYGRLPLADVTGAAAPQLAAPAAQPRAAAPPPPPAAPAAAAATRTLRKRPALALTSTTPPPRAEKKAAPTKDKGEGMKLLITESNNYYRRGDPFFFPYKDVKLGDGTWPAILLKLTSPVGRPDIIETNGVLLYNGLYLDEHMTVRITKYHATIVELPAWARKADVWFISNQPVNMPSHRVTSSWRAIPVAPAAAAGRLRSLLDDSCEYIVPDLHTDRVVANGAGGTSEVNEETLMVVGSCDLSLKATKKYYNKELISFKLFDKNSISQPLDSFLPDALKVTRRPQKPARRAAAAARCPPHRRRAHCPPRHPLSRRAVRRATPPRRVVRRATPPHAKPSCSPRPIRIRAYKSWRPPAR